MTKNSARIHLFKINKKQVHKKTCPRMPVAALFIKWKTGKHPRSPSVDERIHKLAYFYNGAPLYNKEEQMCDTCKTRMSHKNTLGTKPYTQ